MVLALQEPDLDAMLKQVSPARLRATVEKLSSWNTRNTSTPELTQAAEWLAGEYRKIPGIEVELMKYTLLKGRRVPEEKEVLQVVARLRGEDDRMVLVGGHMDTINMQPDADLFKARAPGANDDGSGTALALELARVMAGNKWKHTLVFVGFSGEEQGLNGSSALAKRAKDEGWKLDAVLSNDMVGNPGNLNGQSNSKEVRVFSDDLDPKGENHQQSRELARFIEWATRDKVKGHGVKLVMRRDRYGRGGDHTPFSQAGFNAVRFTEVHEEYSRQHTDKDLPESVDWEYLANNVRMNLAAMAALGNAAEPPTGLKLDTRQGHDSHLTWTAVPGVAYVVYWRDTGSPVWQGSREVGAVGEATIEKVNKDDHFFAVGAVGGIPVVAR